jgi:thiopurine S-methyltransferase
VEPAFWLKAWEEGKRGFHRDEVHPDLMAHATDLFERGGTVLVPLCGATHDLAWLRDQGYWAVGVELSRLAVLEIAERDGLAETGPDGTFTRFDGDGISVLLGNFFDLTPELVGPLTGIWDRAALVALHPSQRADYVALQRRLLGNQARLLLNVMAYDQSVAEGPPWSVDGGDVGALWPEAEILADREIAMPGRFDIDGRSRLYRVR